MTCNICGKHKLHELPMHIPVIDSCNCKPAEPVAATPGEKGEILKHITRPIVHEDIGPDVDYSDDEIPAVEPQKDSLSQQKRKHVMQGGRMKDFEPEAGSTRPEDVETSEDREQREELNKQFNEELCMKCQQPIVKGSGYWLARNPCIDNKGHQPEDTRPEMPPATQETLERIAENCLLATWDKDYKFTFSQVRRLMAQFLLHNTELAASVQQEPLSAGIEAAATEIYTELMGFTPIGKQNFKANTADLTAINKITEILCHLKSTPASRTQPAPESDDLRNVVVDILSNCANKYCHPGGYSRPQQTVINEQIDNAVKILQKFFTAIPEATNRDKRQKEAAEWCAAAFGADHQSSVPQRGIRMLEEAIEAYQSAVIGLPCGEMKAKAHALVDYVMDRLAGNLAQECGGVALTLLALCEAAAISAEAEELREIARVKSKPLAHFAQRNQVKNEAGFKLAPETTKEEK